MFKNWFNIRFGCYHLHAGPGYIKWKFNQAQADWREESPNTWKWFAIYTFFGKRI